MTVTVGYFAIPCAYSWPGGSRCSLLVIVQDPKQAKLEQLCDWHSKKGRT